MYGDAFKEWVSLSDNPQIEDAEWTHAIETQLSTMQLAYNEVIQMNPPDPMAQIHYNQCQYMKYLNEVVELETEGIIYHDEYKRNQALAKMGIVDEYHKALDKAWDDFEAAYY